MTRTQRVVTLIVGIIACCGVYALKYKVESLEARRVALARTEIANEDAIRISWAEWHYLNTPERLQSLSAKYLPLEITRSRQIGSIEDLPMRGEQPKEFASAKSGVAGAAGADDLLRPTIVASLQERPKE